MEDARRFEEKILDRYARMLEAQGIHGPSRVALVTATTPKPDRLPCDVEATCKQAKLCNEKGHCLSPAHCTHNITATTPEPEDEEDFGKLQL